MIASLMLYGVAVSALAWLVAFLLERGAALAGGARRFVWIAALVASLAIPAVRVWVETPAEQMVPPWHITAIQPDGARSRLQSSAAPSPKPALAEHSPTVPALRVAWPSLPGLDRVLVVLWGLGSAAVIGALVVSWLQLARAARALPTRDVEGTAVLVSGNLGPAVIGFVHPRIVLPHWLLDSPGSRRAMVLAHEREHVDARDQLLLLAGLLCVAAAPWNPLLWRQLRQLRFAIEVDCDARVLRQGTDPHRYGEMLLIVSKWHARTSLAAVALTEPASHLERRIRIMMQQAPRHARLAIAALFAAAAACVAAAAGLDPPDAVKNETLQLKPRAAEAMPGLQKLIDAVQSRHPEVVKGALPRSVLITAVLNEDGSVRTSKKEEVENALGESQEARAKRFGPLGFDTRKGPSLTTFIRTRTEGERTVDLVVAMLPIDREALDAKVAAAIQARYPQLRSDELHLITIAMNADGTVRSGQHETLTSRDESRELPKLHRFAALGIPESEMGYVGVTALPRDAGAGANVFVQYVMPRSERDSYFPPPFERARTERALVERHFPDLLGEKPPAHELAWLLLDQQGALVSTGRTPLALDDLAREIEARNPGFRLDNFRSVNRLRSMFDTQGIDAAGEPVSVAFLWLAGNADPQPGRYALDATIYRNGKKVSASPVNLAFGEPGRVVVPGELRVDLSSTKIGGASVIARVDMRVHAQEAAPEFTDHWLGVAAAAVQLDKDNPWRMGPTNDNPATATDEGGWQIELTLKAAGT